MWTIIGSWLLKPTNILIVILALALGTTYLGMNYFEGKYNKVLAEKIKLEEELGTSKRAIEGLSHQVTSCYEDTESFKKECEKNLEFCMNATDTVVSIIPEIGEAVIEEVKPSWWESITSSSPKESKPKKNYVYNPNNGTAIPTIKAVDEATSAQWNALYNTKIEIWNTDKGGSQ